MNKYKNTILRYSLVTGIAMVMAVLLLFLVSLIPQGLLKDNVYKGRENTLNGDLTVFRLTEDDNYSTFIDNAIDEVMIQLSYDLGSEKYSDILNPAVYADRYEGELRYGRYWHGYIVIIRPLLMFFGIESIRTLFMIVNIVMFTALIAALIYKKRYMLSAFMVLSFYIAYFNAVLKCLEYSFCIFISLLFSLIFVMSDKIRDKYRYIAFFITGIATAYFDFLTFETLTLTLPLIVFVCVNENTRLRDILIMCCNWVIGYVFIFAFKLGLLVIHTGGTEAFAGKLGEKFDVEAYTVMDALKLNISALRFSDLVPLWIIIVILDVLIIYVLGIEYKINYYMLLIALIPIVRYCCLTGHSCSHYVFTYHALASSVLAMFLILSSPISFVVSRRVCK